MEEEIWKKAKSNAADILQNNEWVKWVHEGTEPATTQAEKDLRIVWEALSRKKHCAMCMNINGCCFPRNNMPQNPLHNNCHYKLKPISEITVTAECGKDKFEEYIFVEEKSKGKKQLFEGCGYGIMDSKWLKQEFERQAKEKYEKGNFTLNKLDDYGQRINITIELPRKDKIGTLKLTVGWLVYPDGVIKMVTAFGGK